MDPPAKRAASWSMVRIWMSVRAGTGGIDAGPVAAEPRVHYTVAAHLDLLR